MNFQATKAALITLSSAAIIGLTAAPTTAFADSNSDMTMPPAPSIQAPSAIVIDAANGQVLYSKNADERRAPASTTKIMTMLLAEEAVKSGQLTWNTIIPVTPDAYQVAIEPGVSDAYLDPKEKFTLNDMMKFIGVLSANDATVAVADAIGGNQKHFVQMMNDEAKKIGLKNTHFDNPDGLPAPDHYSTARDLATLARYLLTKFPNIVQYTDKKTVHVRKGNTWTSTDHLLGSYPGMDGLKTGFTDAAGYCFVGTAVQNGVRLITVVMGDQTEPERFADTRVLLNYGFHDFHEVTLAPAGKRLPQTLYVANAKEQNLAIAPKSATVVDLPTGDTGKPVLKLQKNIKAPIQKGQVVGHLDYMVNNETVASTPVISLNQDNKVNWFVRTWRGVSHFFGHLLHSL